ncbi:MAG: F0F1 ATP synthase subunit B [Gammaproteobacteria bacterium CG22_combo_CG10-13_8_21_14_all_40_8]|nr:MAG: F0F1 ATP synthase subunit B [Gammaproteobacteria bacterium CG22_combo_CG10-13_8_21_14_all_40_8]
MNINMTLILEMIVFAGFVFFCMKFVWPPLMAAIEERQNKIAEGLAAAERGSQDRELAKREAANLLREAKLQAAEIVEQANKRHSQVVESAKGDAKIEADRIKAGAMAELDQEMNRAKESLRAQLAGLAVAGAEKILERSINAQDHQDLLNKLAEQI